MKPILVGVLLVLAYGAGVVVERDRHLKADEVYLIETHQKMMRLMSHFSTYYLVSDTDAASYAKGFGVGYITARDIPKNNWWDTLWEYTRRS